MRYFCHSRKGPPFWWAFFLFLLIWPFARAYALGKAHYSLSFSYGYWSQNIKLHTSVMTHYEAGYALGRAGGAVFEGSWHTPMPAPVQGGVASMVADWGAALPLNGQAGNARALFLRGFAPTWPVYDGHAWRSQPASLHLLKRAFFAPNAAVFPTNTTYIPTMEHVARGSDERRFSMMRDFVRLDAGVSWSIDDVFGLFMKIGRAILLNRQFYDVSRGLPIDVRLDPQERSVRFADGQSAMLDYMRASFQHSDYCLWRNWLVFVRLYETWSVGAGIQWQPSNLLRFSIQVGLRNCVADVIWQDGLVAIPATVASFSENYLLQYGENVLQDKSLGNRRLRGVGTPVVYGMGVQVVLHPMHQLSIQCHYANYRLNLQAHPSQENHRDGHSVDVSHPLVRTPHADEVRNPFGVHQFLAHNIVNTVLAHMDVESWDVSVGYSIIV